MHSKLFFMVVFLLVIAGIGTLALSSFNALPEPINTFVYKLLAVVPSGSATKPYLKKFEGHWQATLTPAQQWSDVEHCPVGTGTLTVHDGQISGVVGAVPSLSVKAHIAVDGTLSGSIQAKQNSGTLQGSLAGMAGSAMWKDALDCSGTMTLSKLEPVDDPVGAVISSFVDGVMLERDGKTQTPSVDEPLYAGDVLTLPAGSSAHLLLGTGFSAEPLDLTGPTTYSVKAPAQ